MAAGLAWSPEERKIRRMTTVYVYQKCSTCRDALKWLDQNGIAHEVKAIRDTPPTLAELKVALTARGGGSGYAGGAVPDGGVVIALAGLRPVRSTEPLQWRAEIESFRQRPAGQFVLRLYREERLQPPA